MKVAVLLTGQLRTFEMVKHLHMNALISKYNADVFLGINPDNNHVNTKIKNNCKTDSETISKAIAFYKPIDTFILDKFDFGDDWTRRLFIQYYVVKHTYKMLIHHSTTHTIKYDLIIRLRFDHFIYSKDVPIPHQINPNIYDIHNSDIINNHTVDKKFIFDEINNNTLYVFGFGVHEHYKYANDQFFYHNHSLIQIMFEFYDNLFTIKKYCNTNNIGNKGAMIECMLYLYITKFNNINLKHSSIGGIAVRI